MPEDQFEPLLSLHAPVDISHHEVLVGCVPEQLVLVVVRICVHVQDPFEQLMEAQSGQFGGVLQASLVGGGIGAGAGDGDVLSGVQGALKHACRSSSVGFEEQTLHSSAVSEGCGDCRAMTTITKRHREEMKPTARTRWLRSVASHTERPKGAMGVCGEISPHYIEGDSIRTRAEEIGGKVHMRKSGLRAKLMLLHIFVKYCIISTNTYLLPPFFYGKTFCE